MAAPLFYLLPKISLKAKSTLGFILHITMSPYQLIISFTYWELKIECNYLILIKLFVFNYFHNLNIISMGQFRNLFALGYSFISSSEQKYSLKTSILSPAEIMLFIKSHI